MEKAEASFASVRFWDPREFPLLVNTDKDIIFLINEKAIQILRSIQFLSPGIKVIDLRPGDVK